MNERNILIVDDDEHYLRLIKAVVEQTGIKAQYASSGEVAVGILKENRFATMITDLNMPGMDGIELAMIAKELSPGINIVMITGDTSPGVRRLAAGAGISKVLAKPCSAERIQSIARGKSVRTRGSK